jgi:hypothetical protein
MMRKIMMKGGGGGEGQGVAAAAKAEQGQVRGGYVREIRPS